MFTYCRKSPTGLNIVPPLPFSYFITRSLSPMDGKNMGVAEDGIKNRRSLRFCITPESFVN